MTISDILAPDVVLAFFSGLLISAFLPNYIKKKAENLATKEDIKNITEKIEAVKSRLEINADAHKSYINQRKLSLLKFYDEISSFYFELMTVNFGDFPMDGGQALYNYQTDFHKAISKILKSYQRLVIYLPNDSNLISYANKITDIVIESRKVLKSNFGSIKSTSIIEEQAYLNIQTDGEDAYSLAVNKANSANEEYWELMNPLIESYREEYQRFISTLHEYLKKSEISTK